MAHKMTQRPADDERIVCAPYEGPSELRIYVTELAQYLHHRGSLIKKFAKRANLLKGCRDLPYVTVHGAQRIIAYIRAIQGAEYMRGRQFHEWNEREQQLMARKRAAKKALAISGAGTEDRASEAPANIGIAETAVVSPGT
jgi:hypothetical protein